MRLDARNLGILLGAAMIIGGLSAPWYVLDMAAAREALGVNTPQMPEMLGQFVREIAAALPDKISVDAWDAFERGDVILLVAALGAAFAALIDRHEISTSAGASAAGLIIFMMLDRPGNVPNELISLSWGPWVALGGAALIVASSRIGGSEKAEEAPTEVDWFARSEQTEHARAAGTTGETWGSPTPAPDPVMAATPVVPPALGDGSRSVPPPGTTAS